MVVLFEILVFLVFLVFVMGFKGFSFFLIAILVNKRCRNEK